MQYVDIVLALAVANGVEGGRHSEGNSGLTVMRNSLPLSSLFIDRCGGVGEEISVRVLYNCSAFVNHSRGWISVPFPDME